MALKRKITKADYDKLAADLKTEYVADGDDNYRLDLDGEEDTLLSRTYAARSSYRHR